MSRWLARGRTPRRRKRHRAHAGRSTSPERRVHRARQIRHAAARQFGIVSGGSSARTRRRPSPSRFRSGTSVSAARKAVASRSPRRGASRITRGSSVTPRPDRGEISTLGAYLVGPLRRSSPDASTRYATLAWRVLGLKRNVFRGSRYWRRLLTSLPPSRSRTSLLNAGCMFLLLVASTPFVKTLSRGFASEECCPKPLYW